MAVLPTLLFLMLGVCEFSRAWLTLDLVTTAAREGARRGVVTPTSAGKVFNSGPAVARIDAMITDPKLNMTRTVTCATPCSSSTNSQVQATVTVTFNTVIPVILPFLSGVTLTQTATMRYETN